MLAVIMKYDLANIEHFLCKYLKLKKFEYLIKVKREKLNIKSEWL